MAPFTHPEGSFSSREPRWRQTFANARRASSFPRATITLSPATLWVR